MLQCENTGITLLLIMDTISMIQFNFLLIGANITKMQEMLADLVHLRPDEARDPIISYQFSYKDILPLTSQFFLATPVNYQNVCGQWITSLHNVLFVFDVTNDKSFEALSPQLISKVSTEAGTNRLILVGYNASGGGASRIPRDKILLFAQTIDFFYYFEVIPKSKFDFRALFRRLIIENLIDFKQQFPEQYQEEIKQARRAKLEIEKRAGEQVLDMKVKE